MEFCRRYALLTFGSEPACGAFSDLASLSNWFASAFPYDTPDTLLRADRRVPFLDDQIRLHARDYPQIANIVRDLQDRIILMRGPQNFHEGNAVLLAALRYEFLVKWLSGSPIDRSDIERAEHLHLAEWHYENRPLTAVDQVAQAYRMLEPTPALPHTALALPKPAPRQPAREIRQIVAWLRKKDPTTVSRRFLFGDTLAYIVHGRGVEPSQAAPYLTRANALVTSSTDPAAHVAGRYLFAVIRKAEMPVEIRREYRTLLTVHAKSNATPFTAPAYRILADLGNHEADLAALQDAVRVGLHAGAAVQALDSQQQRVRAMENCFNTYIHEWELVRRTGGSIDDERARLAPTVQRAFCSA
ncbi:MAG: hypothetical protein JO233_09785 [Candidatus Eremiobacteraeota bacterium]|nr:hypothetical protein [Candidatus Eremiobacteraeota bacterium]